jgi:hypothetical protein
MKKQMEELENTSVEEPKVKRFRAKLNEKYFRFKLDNASRLVVAEETETHKLLDDVLFDGKNYYETFEECANRMEYVKDLKGYK